VLLLQLLKKLLFMHSHLCRAGELSGAAVQLPCECSAVRRWPGPRVLLALLKGLQAAAAATAVHEALHSCSSRRLASSHLD